MTSRRDSHLFLIIACLVAAQHEEPLRDPSGHRRYSAAHAFDLVKMKALADGGLPLFWQTLMLSILDKAFKGER